MPTLSREDILAADDIPTEPVSVPEWAKRGLNTVLVRGMTGAERDAYEMMMWESRHEVRDGRAQIRAVMVAWTCVDESGKRLFSDDDIPALGRKSGRVLDRLYEVAQRLSGIGEPALRRAVGNSARANGGASSSDSRSPSDEPPANSSPA